ncbi:ubiquinone anaerobic biosynthesis accessory factor UbiT [Bosea lathyri]|uniref:Predicted lipid carrier protein YhbT, contains SCP2 domain n=1 Tax=Bosea lathyri TaxID=1036778 RepID=A0A1H6APS8_9HYPH|nr:SCP2 sterol-binding domain-containing protein [Bosea lathyri]SEG50200.1 Predicted lipid carrier protein YhbT, contains SCP2 domain [Bosea lathyri]
MLNSATPNAAPSGPLVLPPWLTRAMTPLPLGPLQPLLALTLSRIGRLHPELYGRLGEHAEKSFGIAPTDLPFAFVLEPRPERPQARAVRELPPGLDVRIRGSLSGLIGMAEGRIDGDALFFSRTLSIEGDMEATLALRNALDDARLDFGTLLLGCLGPLGTRLAEILRRQAGGVPPGPVASGGPSWN